MALARDVRRYAWHRMALRRAAMAFPAGDRLAWRIARTDSVRTELHASARLSDAALT